MICRTRTASSYWLVFLALTLLTVVPKPAYAGGVAGSHILPASLCVTICMAVLAIPALLWAISLQGKEGVANLTCGRTFTIVLITSACGGLMVSLWCYLSHFYVGLPRPEIVEYLASSFRQLPFTAKRLIEAAALIGLPVGISFIVTARTLLHSDNRESAGDKANRGRRGRFGDCDSEV